jgi:hypothetical protein
MSGDEELITFYPSRLAKTRNRIRKNITVELPETTMEWAPSSAVVSSLQIAGDEHSAIGALSLTSTAKLL